MVFMLVFFLLNLPATNLHSVSNYTNYCLCYSSLISCPHTLSHFHSYFLSIPEPRSPTCAAPKIGLGGLAAGPGLSVRWYKRLFCVPVLSNFQCFSRVPKDFLEMSPSLLQEKQNCGPENYFLCLSCSCCSEYSLECSISDFESMAPRFSLIPVFFPKSHNLLFFRA